MTDKETDNLTDLLQRWAELEPERCRQEESGWWGVQSGDGEWVCVLGNTWDCRSAIQAAVQAAIEARGWEWAVARDNNPGSTGVEFHRAWITKHRTGYTDVDGPDRFVRDSMDSACVALLSAYIAALEAETKTKVATDEAVKAAVDDCGKRIAALTGEGIVDMAKRWLKNFEELADLRHDRFVMNQRIAHLMLEWIVAKDDRDKTAPPRDLPTEASVLVDHEQRLKRLEDLPCCYPTETSK